jgi:hypothetical protein
MDNNTDLVLGKLMGIRDGLTNLKTSELDKRPHRAFAENYNKARDLAVKNCPEITDFAPPEVRIIEPSGTAIGGVAATYTEIRTYCEELIKLISRASMQKGRTPVA